MISVIYKAIALAKVLAGILLSNNLLYNPHPTLKFNTEVKLRVPEVEEVDLT